MGTVIAGTTMMAWPRPWRVAQGLMESARIYYVQKMRGKICCAISTGVPRTPDG